MFQKPRTYSLVSPRIPLCYLSILWNGFRSIGNMWIINIRMTFFAERYHRCHRIYDKGLYIPTGTAAAHQINCCHIRAANMRGTWKLYTVLARQYQTIDTMFTRPLYIDVVSSIKTSTLCLWGLRKSASATDFGAQPTKTIEYKRSFHFFFSAKGEAKGRHTTRCCRFSHSSNTS